MLSGCCKFQGEEADNCARVGREEEDTSSNRPELGDVVFALQSAALSEDVLLLCDNAAVLCAITKWVGQGGKPTLATAPDADILRETVCLLTQRVRAGRDTFLLKVESHRGEPINERADTLAEEGREISDNNKRGNDRTDRMTFEVQKGDTMVHLVWTNSVRNAFQRQQQQNTGQNGCGTATINAGCGHRKKIQKHQGVGVSRAGMNGARNALRI